MSRFREFPKAGNVLDLSRNYYLRDDGTYEEFPVKVIYLPAAPGYQSSSPSFSTSMPVESTTSGHPKAAKFQHSSSATASPFFSKYETSTAPNILPSSPLSTELDGQTKVPKTAKNKANSSGGRANKQKLDPDLAFAKIVSGIYQDKHVKRMIMEEATALAMERAASAVTAGASASNIDNKKKRGRPKKINNSELREKPADHQEKKYKKRGWPRKIAKQPEQRNLRTEVAINEINKNKKRGRPRKIAQDDEPSFESEFRNFEDSQTGCELKKKSKPGCEQEEPRNDEKSKNWKEQQLNENHSEQHQSSQRETNMHKDNDFQHDEGEMPEEIQQQESRTPEELEHEEPMMRTVDEPIRMTKEVEQEEPIARPREERKRQTERNNAAIFAALANISLQLTKMTTDVAQLIVMVSGKLEDD